MVKGKLPIGGRPIERDIRLACHANVSADIVRVSVALVVFALVVWVAIAPNPRLLNALGAIERSGFALLLVGFTVPLMNSVAVFFAIPLVLFNESVAIRFLVGAPLGKLIGIAFPLLLVDTSLALTAKAVFHVLVATEILKGKRLVLFAYRATPKKNIGAWSNSGLSLFCVSLGFIDAIDFVSRQTTRLAHVVKAASVALCPTEVFSSQRKGFSAMRALPLGYVVRFVHEVVSLLALHREVWEGRKAGFSVAWIRCTYPTPVFYHESADRSMTVDCQFLS